VSHLLPVAYSQLYQKQNSTNKKDRNLICPSRRWVTFSSLWKAELYLQMAKFVTSD